jgi:hypothetical protein
MHVAGKRIAQGHKKRWLIWAAASLLAVAAVAAAVLSLLYNRAEPYIRARIVAALAERFHAHVELDSFHLSLLHGLEAKGNGLRIWSAAQSPGSQASTSAAPIIRIQQFRFHAPLVYKRGEPLRISRVELKGLEIDLPPHSRFIHAVATQAQRTTPKQDHPLLEKSVGRSSLVSFKVESIECTGARLTLETDKPGKLPLLFDIARLKLTGLAANSTTSFEAELTNPRPVGTIHATGNFGPWNVGDPGESPITGSYRFENADLSTFKGIAGKLNSTGNYKGTLRELNVAGNTTTPDFRLSRFGNALPLHTRFNAIVDATSGDTRLDHVDATLGHSHITAQGQIVRATGNGKALSRPAGHDISLNLVVDHARIEDFLRLTSRSTTPLLTGLMTMKTTLLISHGPLPLHERMQLDGSFTLDQARFSSSKVQGRIAELSLRGQGRPDAVKSTDPASILAQLQGNFRLANGLLTLPALTFTVPGAGIQLSGTYGLDGGALDFDGTARMQATVSEMVGGWKGLLLKPADRLFKKDGAATEIGITLRGTREDPKFGIDFNRMKRTSPQRPGSETNH